TIGSLIYSGEWPHWHIGIYCAITGVAFLVGFFAARIDRIERMFADQAVLRAECAERAKGLFAEYGVFKTSGRTGVLLYVSLFEHVVIVLGDSAISARTGPSAWSAIVETIVKSLQGGNLERGIIDGIEML